MRIVRTLWGDDKTFLREIPSNPSINELVLTFEKYNYDFLKERNYDVQLIKKSLKVEDFYLNKLVLLNEISKDIDFLFLDWDVEVDSLDNIETVITERTFNVPLYSYPKDYYSDIKKKKIELQWFKNHENWTKKLDVWKLPDRSFVLPCFCSFTNTKSNSILSTLLDIGKKYQFNSCSEEFSFFYYLRNTLKIKTLDEYLHTVEPIFMFGREIDYIHNYLDYKHNTLNSYILTKVTKIPKLFHR